LQNPDFRFYLVGESKRPIEKKWNTDNCYRFFHPKVLSSEHNLGVVTGYGGLIVIDFDDRQFYKSKGTLKNLPLTFCVRTATKELYHLYYVYKGDMFKKIAIKDDKGKVLCDIQAEGGAAICPPSMINGKPYKIVTDLPIAEVTLEDLQKVFNFTPEKKREWHGEAKANFELFNNAVKFMEKQGIRRTGYYKFECPFHPSVGGSNLAVFPDGALKCFHCDRYFSTVHYFIDELLEWRKNGNKR
jgi:hypothetical protein